MMKHMGLNELLRYIEEDTCIWVSTSENDEDAIFFGDAGSITLGMMRGYNVKKYYPERYPSKFCIGISIIVEKKD